MLITSNWEYRWGDSPYDENGTPIWTLPEHADSGWMSGEGLTSAVFEARRPVLWFRIALPEFTFRDPILLMEMEDIISELRVYHDGELLYSSPREGRFGFSPQYRIPLPSSLQGARLFLRIATDAPLIGIDEPPALFSQSRHFPQTVKREISPFLLGSFAVFLGITAVAIFIGRREQRLWFALSFGAFSISIGLFVILDEAETIAQILIARSWLLYYGQGISFLLFPAALFAFIEHILHGRPKRIIRRTWQGYGMLAAAALILDLTGVFFLHKTIELLLGLFGIVITAVVVLIIRAARQGSAEARVLMAGFFLFAVFSVRDIAISLNLLCDPGNRLYYWGLFLFLLCIGHILENRFVLAEALRESEEKYRTLFENLQDVFYRTDPDGVVLLASPSVRQLLGYTEQSIAGIHLPRTILANPDEWRGIHELVRSKGRVEGFELQLRRSDGTLVWGSASAQFYQDSEGRIAGIEGTIRDISEHKQAEEELLAAHRELQDTLEELQQTQGQLIQSEKMAALGKLIANIAHEINTPIGAIRASAENVAGALHTTIQHFPFLLQQISNERLTGLFALVARGADEKESLTSKEERRRRRRLQRELEEYSIPDADGVADTLIDMGIYGDIETLLPLLRDPHCAAILKAADQFSIPLHHNANILTAVDRVSKIVFALKSYIAHDASGVMVAAHVPDNIAVVLSLYHNQLHQNITVITHYDEVPPVLAHPDELGQVWTHLIHNAIQAMAGQGTLEIRVSSCEPHQPSQAAGILAQITDSGCGIPEENLERIFEPFFTTKASGEGSGLGLDICRKIIEKHQGKISVESQPGRTTFSVFLPLFQNEPASP